MRRMLSLVAIVLLGIGVAQSQTPAIESPTDGIYPEWSVNSRLFVYQNTSKDLPRTNSTNSDVFLEYPYWEAFNPYTGEWFESTTWPLYPDLSDEEKAIFQTEGFMRISPDGEILVYPSLENHLLTIANRTTRQIFETDIDYDGLDELPLWWSEDGQGFAVMSAGESPYILDPKVYYVRLRDPLNLTHTVIYPIEFVQPARIGNRLFRPISLDEILDVHQHLILMTLSDVTNVGNAAQSADEAQSYLIISNPENPDNSVIINAVNGSNVRAAAFAPDNPQRILLILGNERVDLRFLVQRGLYVYDLQSKDLKFLVNLDQYFIEYPYFSPDGEWLAVKLSGISQFAFFRTRDLLTTPPQFKATPFPTFTPFPTYTPTPVLTSTPSPTLSS